MNSANRRVITKALAIAIGALGILAVSVWTAAAQTAAPGTKSPAQGLWIRNLYFVSEFQGAALKRTSQSAPRVTLGSANPNRHGPPPVGTLVSPRSLAFDHSGNLWVSYLESPDNINVGSVIELTPYDLKRVASHHRVAPQVILANQGQPYFPFFRPESIVFDTQGDLWVSDLEGRRIMKFTPDQIAQSGAPTPAVTIASSTFWVPAIHFDKSGDLWALESADIPELYEFTPDQLQNTGSRSAAQTLELTDLRYVGDFGFDPSGNLWVPGLGSNGHGMIEMFRASDLNAAGSFVPAPAIKLTSSEFGTNWLYVPCMDGLDFDAAGDLWVASGSSGYECPFSTFGVLEFTPSQLASGGNLRPSKVIEQKVNLSNVQFPGVISFGPTVH